MCRTFLGKGKKIAKILISSLGTGRKQDNGYREATYEYKGQKEKSTFISKSLSKMLDIDKLFIVGTNGSIWDSCYKQFGGEDEDIELELFGKIEEKNITEIDLEIVNQTISAKLNSEGSKCFLIDYGLNEEELWGNFDKYIQILDKVEDGDTIYIDISHAFRSLALMSFLMIQFGHGIKNKKFNIGGIYYGMLEATKNEITPIVDLKIFYDLMEWIKAIDAFKNYGHADLLVKLFDSEKNIKSQTSDTFNQFDINLSMANMSALRSFIENAKRVLPVMEKSNNHIVRLISPDILDFIKRLDKPKISDFQLELAKWFYDNTNYALSYIILVEALVTKECELMNINIHDKDTRNRAKNSLYSTSDEIKKTYKSIAGIRNNIAHQKESSSDTIKDVKNLKEYIIEVTKYCKK